MAALQYIDRPAYNAILFRRTFTDLALPDALMERAGRWLRPTNARWRERDRRWHFPSGATITFGHLDSENDKYNYQSSAFHFIGFDELTQFSETQYTYLFSRLRRSVDTGIPTRMRAATNPGGIGHEWVKRRFIDEQTRAHRIFVASRLEDNPSLDREDYEESLAELDYITRAQLREGDWEITEEGKKFKREWFVGKTVDFPPPNLRWVRFWDMAATEPKPGKDPDYTVGTLMGMSHTGHYYIADVRRFRHTPGKVEEIIKETAAHDGYATEIWMEQEPGSSGVTVIDHYLRTVLRGWPFRGITSTGKKEVRATPLSCQCEGGNVFLVRGDWVSDWIREIVCYPTPGIHDDQVDSASGAMRTLTQGGPASAPAAEEAHVPAWRGYVVR